MVYLYKREFFGIDKDCDEKYNFNEDTSDILHSSEQSEFYLLLAEGFSMGFFSLPYIVLEIIRLIKKIPYDEEKGDDLFSRKAHCYWYIFFIAFLVS